MVPRQAPRHRRRLLGHLRPPGMGPVARSCPHGGRRALDAVCPPRLRSRLAVPSRSRGWPHSRRRDHRGTLRRGRYRRRLDGSRFRFLIVVRYRLLRSPGTELVQASRQHSVHVGHRGRHCGSGTPRQPECRPAATALRDTAVWDPTVRDPAVRRGSGYSYPECDGYLRPFWAHHPGRARCGGR